MRASEYGSTSRPDRRHTPRAIGSKKLKGEELEYLFEARTSERAHYKALAGVLKAATPKGLAFQYQATTFASRLSIAKTGVALETAFVGAYLGAVTALKSNDLKSVAATITASEASHLSVFSDIATGWPTPSDPREASPARSTKRGRPRDVLMRRHEERRHPRPALRIGERDHQAERVVMLRAAASSRRRRTSSSLTWSKST